MNVCLEAQCDREATKRGLCHACWMRRDRIGQEMPPRLIDQHPVAPPPPGAWVEHAACKGAPTSIWFSERGENRVMRAAKEICGECPVADPCLAYALEHGIKHGTWGGKSERERRLLRREQRLETA